MSNNRLAYGLAAEYGIDTNGKTPYEVWEALKKIGKAENIYNSDDEKSSKVKSLEDFLGERGLESPFSDYSLDKVRIPHGETLRQKNARLEATEQAIASYSEKRNKAIKEYNTLIESGELKHPSTIERALQTAKGHEDNASVQAARRLLEKKGIDWQSGEEVKEQKSKPNLSPLQAFKEDARQFNEALDYAKQNGYAEVRYKSIDGKERRRYWSGGRWEERPSSMYSAFSGGNQKGAFNAAFKNVEEK